MAAAAVAVFLAAADARHAGPNTSDATAAGRSTQHPASAMTTRRHQNPRKCTHHLWISGRTASQTPRTGMPPSVSLHRGVRRGVAADSSAAPSRALSSDDLLPRRTRITADKPRSRMNRGVSDGTRTHDRRDHNPELPPAELRPPCAGDADRRIIRPVVGRSPGSMLVCRRSCSSKTTRCCRR
jgi:hypothetical protein